MNSIKTVYKANHKSDREVKNFQPINLLSSFIKTYGSGCLEVESNSLSWWIYFKNGKIIYASHGSQDSLTYSLSWLKLKLRNTSIKAFYWLESHSEKLLDIEAENNRAIQYFEYQIIHLLSEQKNLELWQAAKLTEQLTKKTLESFFSLQKGCIKAYKKFPEIQIFCQLDLNIIIEYHQARSKVWKTLNPLILSPHQRPYIINQEIFCRANELDVISPRLKNKLAPILKGYSIRHIAALLQQDELEVAKLLYPYIENQSIVLRDAEPPFDQLSKFQSDPIKQVPKSSSTGVNSPNTFSSHSQLSTPNKTKTTQTVIACVDDSPNTLDQIERFLERENFLIFKFLEPIKATFQLRRIKPDIILLDLTMPKISGYELCRMLRNLTGFEKTPIVMVTGKKGIIDKARAKLVGATDYLEKPFTRDSLLNVINRNLT